jgi:hypothetical protein
MEGEHHLPRLQRQDPAGVLDEPEDPAGLGGTPKAAAGMGSQIHSRSSCVAISLGEVLQDCGRL